METQDLEAGALSCDICPAAKKSKSPARCPTPPNNQMELEAVIQGLSALKRSCSVEVFTDSVYVGKGISEWMPKWKTNDWKRRDGKKWVEVKNVEFLAAT